MITVVGGTGHLGREVVRLLLAEGHAVRVCAKGAASATDLAAAGAELVPGDIRDAPAVARALEGATVAVCAAQGLAGTGRPSPASVDRDGNRIVVDAAGAAGAAVVLVSVVGAGPEHPVELHRMKGAAEAYLRSSGVPWTIVRGTAFIETWSDVLRSSANAAGRVQVFGRGRNPVNFVSVRDMAAAVARAAVDPALRGQVIEVGGPDQLTLDQLAHLVAPGTEPRHVPRTALRVTRVLARPVQPQLARRAEAALAMDTMDMTFDAAPAHAAHPWLSSTRVTAALA